MSSVSDATVRVGHGVIAGVSGLVIEHGGRCASLTDLVSDPPQLTVLEVISAWSEWRQLIVDAAANLGGATTSIATADVVWEIPTRPAKLICIGANYFDHIAEMPTAPRSRSRRRPSLSTGRLSLRSSSARERTTPRRAPR
jgi:2-keto-4-pentenoate hydratase/2-oxohepta-3-ene-1,7-dioic acid hydratase in catechol pathway